MAGLGPEHERAEWLDAERTAFKGWNRMGDRAWDVHCPAVTYEPPTAFAFAVGDDPADASSTGSTCWSSSGPPKHF